MKKRAEIALSLGQGATSARSRGTRSANLSVMAVSPPAPADATEAVSEVDYA